MRDELIKYETAKLAKEKGFNLKVYNYFQIGTISKGVEEHSTKYINDINTTFKESAMFSRPTQGLLQRWLREMHDLTFSVYPNQDGEWTCNMTSIKKYVLMNTEYGKTYEKALELGLLEALKLI